MAIVAALFVVFIVSVGLLNSYRKYKNELLPSSFLAFHFLIGLMVIIGVFYLLFE